MASASDSTLLPSRRRFFASAIVAGACAGTVMGPNLDGPLLDACAAALFKGRQIQSADAAENWSDDKMNREVDAYYVPFETAVATPATTREGLIAKAWLVEHEFPGLEQETADRRLLRSLLRDLTTQPFD